MKRLYRNNVELCKRAQSQSADLDNPELKYWWAQKCLWCLAYFETTDGILDFEKVDSDYFDLFNRLSEFQKDPNTFFDLLSSYFCVPWGMEPYFNSHGSAEMRILVEYVKCRWKLEEYIQKYVPPKESRIRDFISYFELSSVEIEILFFGLIKAYTLDSIFVLSNTEEDIYEKISSITNLPIEEIRDTLSIKSALLKENIFYITQDDIFLNPEWDEYFFEGQIYFRKRLLKLHSKMSHLDHRCMKRKRREDLESLENLPYEYFAELISIKKLFSYPDRVSYMVDFNRNKGSSSNLFGRAVKDLGIRHEFRDIDYNLSELDNFTIIDGNLSVFFSEKDFLLILDELKKKEPRFFAVEISSKLKESKDEN